MFPLQRPLTGSVVDLVLWLLRSLGITNRVAFLLDESGGFALMHIFVRSRVDCFFFDFFPFTFLLVLVVPSPLSISATTRREIFPLRSGKWLFESVHTS